MAPEAVSDDASVGEHLDVFSLGAIAYHLFSGQPPAPNGVELSNKLRETNGLQISSVLNGAGESLQELVQWSTHADVGVRLNAVDDFLELLEKVEDEATAPDHDEYVDDPIRAKKDDVLPENYRVVRRLGQGGCSVALLVEKDGQEFVLKAANDPEHNVRLKDEAEVRPSCGTITSLNNVGHWRLAIASRFSCVLCSPTKRTDASRRCVTVYARRGVCTSICCSDSATTSSVS